MVAQYNFQFGFLGLRSNYLAQVTLKADNGVPQEPCFCKTFGLPIEFVTEYNGNSYPSIFFFNFRGHDAFSYSAEYTGKGVTRGYVQSSLIPIGESALLKSLSQENKARGGSETNIKTTYGPNPGCIFAAARGLKRYRWRNLPESLEEEVQNVLNVAGYGDNEIYEVAINGAGGWVMLLERGQNFVFGGDLPLGLRKVLEDVRETKRKQPKLDASIYRIYLNHQNPDEYVLLFNDGQCFVNLHTDFQKDIESVLERWAKGNRLKRYNLTFTSSSDEDELDRKALNALYYCQRGCFFLERKNAHLAMKYLYEASHQDEENTDVRESYFLSLVAMKEERGSDPILERQIKRRKPGPRIIRPQSPRAQRKDKDTFFRDEYMWMLDELDSESSTRGKDVADRIEELEKLLGKKQRPYLDEMYRLSKGIAHNPLKEWSYNGPATPAVEAPEIDLTESPRPGSAFRVDFNGRRNSDDQEEIVFEERSSSSRFTTEHANMNGSSHHSQTSKTSNDKDNESVSSTSVGQPKTESSSSRSRKSDNFAELEKAQTNKPGSFFRWRM